MSSITIIKTEFEKYPHNPHYLNRYIKLISLAIAENHPHKRGNGRELHHILPKSMFPEYKNFKDNRWNGISLTPRLHYIAHWLLWKSYPETGMSTAFKMMTSGKRYRDVKVTGRIYAILKDQAAAQKRKLCGSKHPHYGKKKSPEHCANIKKSQKGKTISRAHVEAMRQSNIGRKMTESNKEKLREAHKGKTLSAEHRKKISESHKGKKLSPEHIEKMRNRHVSEETRKKLRDRPPLSESARKKISESQKGKVFPQEHIERTRQLNCKSWLITMPDGTTTITKDRTKFCKDNNLNYSSLKCAAQESREYRGFRCVELKADDK